MKVKASLKNLRVSPRKVRLVADLIRGLDVGEAEVQLKFLVKRSARPLFKLLNSAVANAENNFSLDKNNLYISEIFVNQGQPLKRWMPRAFGRVTPILKRTSHIILILEEKVPTPGQKTKKKKETGKKPEEIMKEEKDVLPEEKIDPLAIEETEKPKPQKEKRPYGASTASKKRFFSRQTFGNVKKTFKRKSI